jgi:hypothetical protein
VKIFNVKTSQEVIVLLPCITDAWLPIKFHLKLVLLLAMNLTKPNMVFFVVIASEKYELFGAKT